MKILKLLGAVALLFSMASCSKNNPAPTKISTDTITVKPGSNVYIAGIVDNKATLWKNGVATTLSSGSERSYAMSVYVNGADVYVAGYGTDANNGNGVALIWKNGVATVLTATNPDAQAVSVYVSPAGSVYAVGYTTVMYQNNQAYPNNGILSYHAATLWVNGAPTILSDGNKAFFDNNGLIQHGQNTNRESAATGVCADAGAVFVSGWEDYGAYGQVNATLWKNNNKLILYNPIGGDYTSNEPKDGFLGKFFGGDTTYVIPPNFSLNSINQATSVFASTSGVYVAGFVTQGAQNGGIQVNAPHRATVWKNGIEKAQGDSTSFANPNAIYVSGSDVYAVGFSFPTGKTLPTVWKNGIASILNFSGTGAVAKGVFVSGTDVYVAGTATTGTSGSASKGILWKNGTPTDFTDPTNTTYITSVFVK